MKLSFMTITVAMLSFSGFVQAQLSDGQFEFCQNHAEMAHAMADLRDDGHSIEEIKSLYEHQRENLVSIKNIALEYIFTYPHLSPKEEANAAYEDCRNRLTKDS